MYAVRDIEEIKERLLSFQKYAKDAQPDVLVTLIQSFVECIYIVDGNDERYYHVFIKGCTKEDYDEFFRATGYISGTRETATITSKLSLCNSDECSKTYKSLFLFIFHACPPYDLPLASISVCTSFSASNGQFVSPIAISGLLSP